MVHCEATGKGAVRVALVGNSLRAMWHFRRPLVETLLQRNLEVWIVAPVDMREDLFQKLGAHVYSWRLHRRSMNPCKEVLALSRLIRAYRTIRPTLVHQFSAKPVVYGSLAARLVGVPVVISNLTGLGYAFIEGRTELRWLLSSLYPLALRYSDALVFQNWEDPQTLGIASHRKVRVIEGGSGVDTSFFSRTAVDDARVEALRQELGIGGTSPVVAMISRMLTDKGVREFVEAAAIVRQRLPQARFLLVGPVDLGNPASIPLQQLEAWHKEGEVVYLGERKDVRELLALAEVVVLPSYREGTPRVLLEGAAMGKPLVATDIPGCHGVVRPGVNGLLVPPRDSAALARAIEELLHDLATRERFGEASRDIAISNFSSEIVVERMLALYLALLETKGFKSFPS